jgi:hypothetical protein
MCTIFALPYERRRDVNDTSMKINNVCWTRGERESYVVGLGTDPSPLSVKRIRCLNFHVRSTLSRVPKKERIYERT